LAEESPLIWYPAFGCYKAAEASGASDAALARIASLPSGAFVSTDGTDATFDGPAIERRFYENKTGDTGDRPAYGKLPLQRLMPPSPESWCTGLCVLLKRVRIKRLYINSRGLTYDIQAVLNSVATWEVQARRRRRSTAGSGSDEDISSFARPYQDDESDQSDNAARLATVDIAAAATGSTVDFRPPFVRNRPRRSVAAAKDLIALEVFSIYGWGVDDDETAEVTPFMRYLARSAPHLREVGLVNATMRAALALRHAVSTSLTGLDLRRIDGLDDFGLATLLRSRAGRRLRSLTVKHDMMFDIAWPYAVLNRPHRGQSSGSGSDDGDVGRFGCDSGNTPPQELSPAAAVATTGSLRLDPEPRLRRLRRVDVGVLFKENRAVAHNVFNGPRVVFTPYAVVPLL
jgi:hypothetical protein